jgi:hypothetical protein
MSKSLKRPLKNINFSKKSRDKPLKKISMRMMVLTSSKELHIEPQEVNSEKRVFKKKLITYSTREPFHQLHSMDHMAIKLMQSSSNPSMLIEFKSL